MENNLIYGEITFQGALDLINNLKENNEINEDSIFVDIGSGYGKLPIIFSELCDISSIGIEIVKEKHDIALKTKWTNKKRIVTYINNDFNNCKAIIDVCNIIYVDCIMWDKALLEKLKNILPKNALLIHNSHTFLREIKHEVLKLNVSWRDELSKFYKLNTNDIR
mgnify:FL=1|jgi:SAM-dependent methyltransferase